MCSVTPREYRRKMSLIVGSDDEDNRNECPEGSPINDEVFYDRKYADDDGESFDDPEERNEDAVCREAIINRIDSLRETRIKVVKKKKPSVRRHALQHSLQPTSYFILQLCDSLEPERITVRRGLTLKQVAQHFFDNNGLDISSYDFFVDGSNSPLPVNGQSDHLVGQTINAVKRRDAVFSRDINRKKRGSTGERLDRLNDTLQAFETTGIPTPKVNSDPKFQVKSKWLYLESSWEKIVRDSEKLSLQDKLQQSVIWELLYTEANYLRNLKSVVDVHLATLVHLQNSDERILSDIDVKKMFSNFEDIYLANGLFWKKYLYRLLKDTRRTGAPFDIRCIYEGFVNIAEQFSPYSSFCINTNECRKYVQLKKDSDPLFGKMLRWADCKISSDSNKEGLKDQLSKPFQRLMRYKLLLDRIKDGTTDVEQYRLISMMVYHVGMFVQDVDDRVAASQKFEALHELAKRMEYCIPHESAGEEFERLSHKFPSFNLLLPMPHNNNYREILYEGPLKFKDSLTKWTEVHCILFSDMFLVGKSSKKGAIDRIKVFRRPIKLEKIFVETYSETPLQYLLYILDDFGFLLMTNVISGTPKKLIEWKKKILSAKKQLTSGGVVGIDRQKLPDDCVPDESGVSLVVTPASPAISRFATPTQTLAITDMRRRFRPSNSSENSLRPSPTNSHSSIEAALAEEEEEEEMEDEVMQDTPTRPKTHFLRTASPVSESPPEVNGATSDSAFRNRRGSRGDRRYRTADSVIPGNNLRSASIHKRLSLNYGGATDNQSPPSVPGLPATSVESFQSSSGFSSSGSAQHLHSGSEYSEPGGVETELRIFEAVGPLRDRPAKRNPGPRHCMSLNDLSRLQLDTINDNDIDEDSPEGNSSSTSVRSVLKQYVLVHSSDGEATDV